MDLDAIRKMGQAADRHRAKAGELFRANEEDEDPIRSIMLEGVSAHNPPGGLGELCEIIGNHFQRRKGMEIARIIGALAAAQVIAGRNVLDPEGKKVVFQLMLLAESGIGKSSMLEFAGNVASALGLHERFKSSPVTSLKQLQMSIIEAGGTMVYLVDDKPSHVMNWDNERSPLEGISNFFRSESSSSLPWHAPAPIRREFGEALALASSPKMLEATARAQGWILPRVMDGKDIDLNALAKMNQDVAKRFAKARADNDLAENPIDRLKFVPVITMTPESARKIVEGWKENGSMGRTFFLNFEGGVGKVERHLPEWNARSFANVWKPRVPHLPMRGKWGIGAMERYDKLFDALDDLRGEGGITGRVASRYGQLMGNMATLCAFMDTASRSATDFTVEVRHMEWAYQACLESLVSMRDYLEGQSEENGMEVNEWESIVSKIKSCVENNAKFREANYLSVLRDKVCRDRVKHIIDACNSSGMNLTPASFMVRVLGCISEYRYAPVEVDPNNPKKVRVNEGGKWKDIPMNQEIRNIMTTAMRKMRFMKK